ncbi:MAG: Asp-tRNA(Asn)/Glu-tRNA(Gln) amidotransferase subunit GatC [Schleiferiaceae bacterium]
MKISKEEIDKLAHLSRLELSGEETDKMVEDMTKVLGFVEKINELDLADTKPLTHVTEEVNILRKDEVIQEISHQEALKNAPDANSDYFKVPKVMRKK